MLKIASLTMDNSADFVIDDELAYPHFQALGWEIHPVSWRSEYTDWTAYNLVLIRTPWDYQQDPTAFLATLERIVKSGTILQNPLKIVRWNMNKTYLRDLERVGVKIVPTLWGDAGSEMRISSWFEALGTNTLIVKPTISANADHTYPIRQDNAEALLPTLREVFSIRAYMVQPFIQAVVSEGEYSVFYFNGKFSHAIIKTPASGDFRVQEEHGGDIREAEPSATPHYAALRESTDKVMQALKTLGFGTPMYARVDVVRLSDEGKPEEFAVMEVELIEPSLYLRTSEGAPERFAQAVHDWMNQKCD
jgi:hypothetical protein